jgi:hypothetical protein
MTSLQAIHLMTTLLLGGVAVAGVIAALIIATERNAHRQRRWHDHD